MALISTYQLTSLIEILEKIEDNMHTIKIVISEYVICGYNTDKVCSLQINIYLD